MSDTYASTPVLIPEELLLLTEHRVNLVARAYHLPLEVLAELQGVTREQYELARNYGATLALVVTPDLVGKPEVNDTLDKEQRTLWTGMFAEIFIDDIVLPAGDDALIALGEFFDRSARSILPAAGPVMAPEHLAEGVTRSLLRADVPPDLHVFTSTPFFASIRRPNCIALHTAIDLRANPVLDEQHYYAWVKAVFSGLPAVLQSLGCSDGKFKMAFVSDFERAYASGVPSLSDPVFDQEVQQKALYRNTLSWLRRRTQAPN